MGNYHYIIASLPDLTLQFEKLNFNFDALHQLIVENMSSKRDKRLLDWLSFGLKSDNLNSHFYRAAAQHKNRFIRQYFAFDREIRNIQVAYVARESNIDPTPHLVGSDEMVDQLKRDRSQEFGLTYFDRKSVEVLKALGYKNILEREQRIDALRWEVASELVIFSTFTVDQILAFLIKCSILERWQKLDSKRGAQLFKELVEEVRGTFQLEENL